MHALAEMELGDALPSCFSSHIGDIPFFRVYLVLYIFLKMLILVTLLFQMDPKRSAEVLSSISRARRI